MIVFYEHPLSPYAQKVKIALREKRIDFEPRLPDLFSGGDADFEAANPRREVPALVDGDLAVFDSTIRLEWMLRSGGVDIVIEGMQRRTSASRTS